LNDSSDSKSVSLEIAEAAVQAVIESAKRRQLGRHEELTAGEDSGGGFDEVDPDVHESMILDELLTQVFFLTLFFAPLLTLLLGVFSFTPTFLTICDNNYFRV
jgi:hypothetical protein